MAKEIQSGNIAVSKQTLHRIFRYFISQNDRLGAEQLVLLFWVCGFQFAFLGLDVLFEQDIDVLGQ